jgi:hypothetical protein
MSDSLSSMIISILTKSTVNAVSQQETHPSMVLRATRLLVAMGKTQETIVILKDLLIQPYLAGLSFDAKEFDLKHFYDLFLNHFETQCLPLVKLIPELDLSLSIFTEYTQTMTEQAHFIFNPGDTEAFHKVSMIVP